MKMIHKKVIASVGLLFLYNVYAMDVDLSRQCALLGFSENNGFDYEVVSNNLTTWIEHSDAQLTQNVQNACREIAESSDKHQNKLVFLHNYYLQVMDSADTAIISNELLDKVSKYEEGYEQSEGVEKILSELGITKKYRNNINYCCYCDDNDIDWWVKKNPGCLEARNALIDFIKEKTAWHERGKNDQDPSDLLFFQGLRNKIAKTMRAYYFHPHSIRIAVFLRHYYWPIMLPDQQQHLVNFCDLIDKSSEVNRIYLFKCKVAASTINFVEDALYQTLENAMNSQ